MSSPFSTVARWREYPLRRLRHRYALYLLDRVGCLCLRPFLYLFPNFRSTAAPARIVILRPEHFGDLVLTLAPLARLRHRFPHAQCVLLVRPEYLDWARQFQIADEVYPIDPPWTRRPRGGSILPFLGSLFRRFPRGQCALVLHGDLRTHLLAWRYASAVAGFRAGGGGFLLRISCFTDRSIPVRLAHQALIDQFVRSFVLPPPRAFQGAPLNAVPQGRESVRNSSIAGPIRLPPIPDRWVPPSPFLVLHPGAGAPAKLWMVERWAELATRCLRRGMGLVLTGTHDDLPLCSQIEAALPASSSDRCRNLAGRTSLLQLTTILARAGAVVAPDTGVIHLARVLDTPSVALFGPIDPARWGYFLPRHRSLTHRFACSFCFLAQCPRRDHPAECMRAISVDEVWNALEEMLGVCLGQLVVYGRSV